MLKVKELLFPLDVSRNGLKVKILRNILFKVV
jgi:hypothetical protein